MTRVTFTPITHKMPQVANWGYGGNTESSSSTLYTSFSTTGYRDSSRTPGFHSPSRQGRLLPNPFEFRLTKRWPARGEQKQATTQYLNGTGHVGSTDNYHFHSVGPMGGNLATASYGADLAPPSDLDGRVRNLLLAEIKDTKANLAELFAERHKAAQMVGDAAINFAKSMLALRKGNFVQAAEHLGVKASKRAASRYSKSFVQHGKGAVANGWLQLQYGWKPLMSDIYGSLEVMASKYESPMYVTTKVRRKQVTPWSSQSIVKSSGLTTTTTFSGEKRTTIQYSVTYFKSASPYNVLSRLGVTNPVLLAWELIPYSFVVDWFLPIGSWLDTFDATEGMEFHSGYRTLFSRSIVNEDQTIRGTSTSNQWNDTHWVEAQEDIFCSRVVLTSFPSNAIPSFKNPLSIGHMENALALLTQIFRK